MMLVRRLPHLDALAVEDGTVVLHGDQASLLTPLSATVWNALSESTWAEAKLVSERLVAEFGAPPSEDAVPNLLAELAAAGLIELGS